MYTSENLERLSDYLLANIYMQRKDQRKASSLEQQIFDKITRDLPQAVKQGDKGATDKIIKRVASRLNVSVDKCKKILNGNFIPVLRLMESARKKVNDETTLLRYLNVITHVNGTNLAKIAQQINKSPKYFNKLVLSNDDQAKQDVLKKCVSLFGVTWASMQDALSRSKIHQAKNSAKHANRKTTDVKKPLEIKYSKQFMDRFNDRKKRWFIPKEITTTWEKFADLLRKRYYKFTKTANKAHVLSDKTDVNTLDMLKRDVVEKKLMKILPDEPPQHLLATRHVYRKQREHLIKTVSEAGSDGNRFVMLKRKVAVKFDNNYDMTVYIIIVTWVLPDQHSVDSSTILMPFVYKRLSAKRRRLLKKYNRDNGRYL